MESGKGKCSYDPKLNSVSALISEYHLASGYRPGHTGTWPSTPTGYHCMLTAWSLVNKPKQHGLLSLIIVSCLLIYECVF